MSFSIETKNELSRHTPEKKCCQLSEIAGFLRASGSLRLAGGGKFKIVITTENAAVARHYKKLIKEYFDVDVSLEIGEASGPNGGYRYGLTINPDQKSDQILRETGILLVKEGNNFISDGIYDDIVRTKCCRKSYLRGIYMASGSITDPEKAYHFEIVTSSLAIAKDLKKLINTFDDINAKYIKRKNHYAVYLKNSQQIRDVLAIMGAHSHALKFDDILLKRAMVNEAVRLTNCDTANTDRALDASEKQIKNIKKIEEKKGLGFLPIKLRQIAEVRLEHPEMSLTQIGEMLDPPLKKSGVNNRFRKIEEIANRL